MKKTFVLCVLLIGAFHGFSQIKISSTGKVGINNTNPTYQLDVSGTMRLSHSGYSVIFQNGILYPYSANGSLGDFGGRWNYLYAIRPTFTYSPDIDSDESFKTDIRNFSAVSQQLNQLRAVKYKLNPERLPQDDTETAKADGDLYGFVAQEVLTIFPDIVTTRKDGSHGIRYTELIPVLVKAFQEQQATIDSIKARIENLETAGK